MPFQNYDVYLQADGVTQGFVITEADGVKQYNVGLAPTLAPQQRLNSNNLYEGQPPEVTVTSPSETWYSGAGVADASGSRGTQSSTNTGYAFSRGIDLSEGFAAFLSPQRNDTSTADGKDFNGHPIQFIDTSIGLFCITENQIYRWDISLEVWESVNSAGSYKAGALEHDGYLYVPRGANPYLYTPDGFAWTASNRSTITSQADAFCNRGDDGEASATYNVIVRLRDNYVSVSTTGVNSGAAWSTEDAIGPNNETSKTITPENNSVVIWKQEGVYTFDFTNVDNFWQANYAQNTNADHVYQWIDTLWYANYGTSVLQFDFVNSTITKVYPTDSMDDDELLGQVTGISGDDSHLYVTVRNENNRTYVMKGKPGNPFHSLAVFGTGNYAAALPGTGSDNSSIGTTSWSNPSNITAQDGSVATFNDATSHYLLASNFGFDIPSDATITGLTADVYKSVTPRSAALTFSSAASWSSGTTVTWSETTNGNDRFLVVGFTYSAGSGNVSASGVTYAGDAMTQLACERLPDYTYYDESSGTYITVTSDVYQELWTLVNPDNSSNSVVVTFTAQAGSWGVFPISFPHTWGILPACVSASFSNVDQGDPTGDVIDGSASGDTEDTVEVGIETPENSYLFSLASTVGNISDITSGNAILEEILAVTMCLGVAEDGLSQDIVVTKSGDGTLYLSNFNINGIGGNITDNSAKFFKAGVAVGTNLADDANWLTSLATTQYGVSDSLPGVAFTFDDVNASTFGFGISATTPDDATGNVEYIEITVYYKQPGITQANKAISIVPPASFHAQNPCILSGYGTDVVSYILPRSNMTPANDPNYLFQTSNEEQFVVGSWEDFGGSAYSKFLNRGTILGTNITSGKSVILEYETNTGDTGTIATATQNGLSTGNISTEIEFHRIRYIATFSTTSATTSPEVYGWTLQATLNQPRYRVWSFTTSLSNEQSLVDGNSDYYQDAVALEDFLFNATKKRPTFTDVNGRSYNVRVADLQSQGFVRSVAGGEERISPIYRVQLLEIGPLSAEVSELTYGSNAWGRERDWS